MSDILASILEDKGHEVSALDRAAWRTAAEAAAEPRDFVGRLSPGEGPIWFPALIAEIKRASPSKGALAPERDPFELAETYAENGAAAVSVVTDRKYFRGDTETLRALRFERRFLLPLLRKDFVIDEVQLFQSRALGADALLLITAALLDDGRFAALHSLALELGLTPLVEVHTAREIERALHLNGLRLLGINNRDLATFRVDIETSIRLRPLVPAAVPVVAESGICTHDDVRRLARAGINAVLVGEALLLAPDIPDKVRELSGMSTMGRTKAADCI